MSRPPNLRDALLFPARADRQTRSVGQALVVAALGRPRGSTLAGPRPGPMIKTADVTPLFSRGQAIRSLPTAAP